MANVDGAQGKVGASPVSFGRFTYGYQRLAVKQWDEGAALRIGSFCSIAENVTIFLGGNHRVDWMTTYPFGHIFVEELGGAGLVGHPATKGDVEIGSDVWLGHGSTIMSGIRIGHGAVIAVNATVVKDVAPYEIVGGNPAKHLKFRFDEEIRGLLLELSWWDLPLDDIRRLTWSLSSAPTPGLVRDLIRRFRGGERPAEQG
ncbi:CatB-related O-acetyltransferase [Phenylobacterium sp.]|uniref:CatB-related O-acetyltransferase n=1 Tax=Phenylobacterium sp. TaxID=1871053 RepID=UPI003566BCDC